MPTKQNEDRSGVSTPNNSREKNSVGRRKFIAGSVGAALSVGLAGCGGVLGGGTSDENTVTMLLTPGTPADARRRYKPVQNLLNAEIDGAEFEMQVPTDYSAIRPALESEQAEIGMDDVTVLSKPELMDIYGTTVTGGSAFYFSMMLVQPDSEIDERTDVEGKTWAFADRLSTSGSIFALYTLQEAGLDIGGAPKEQPNDFEGSWTDHDQALQRLGEGEADGATTWGGNGIPHIPEDTELPDRVKEKSSFLDTIDTESPKFKPIWWSFPIPKQPMYARKTWESDVKEEVGEVLRNSTQEKIEQHYPDDYNEEELPFTTLSDTSIDDYEPVIKRMNAVGIDPSS
ncbi:PhnD/SsuA/transferrin family substrate-binding protein [Salinibaculum salinum]|uniref:PhnD/SsuA/transferrin family substrate-binding protein n=1 Tax=Salinibaculum salinum TaxID=3131996 RepID=UPI0030EC5C7F